jgi:hypothetical protein
VAGASTTPAGRQKCNQVVGLLSNSTHLTLSRNEKNQNAFNYGD